MTVRHAADICIAVLFFIYTVLFYSAKRIDNKIYFKSLAFFKSFSKMSTRKTRFFVQCKIIYFYSALNLKFVSTNYVWCSANTKVVFIYLQYLFSSNVIQFSGVVAICNIWDIIKLKYVKNLGSRYTKNNKIMFMDKS